MIKERLLKYGNLLLLLSIFTLAVAYYICVEEESFGTSVFGFPLISIGYGLLVMGAISPACFLYKFKSPVSATIATLSYAIYLTHKIIIHLTQAQFSKYNVGRESGWMLLVCVTTCMAGALLMNKIIEQPLLAWRGKILATIKRS